MCIHTSLSISSSGVLFTSDLCVCFQVGICEKVICVTRIKSHFPAFILAVYDAIVKQAVEICLVKGI